MIANIINYIAPSAALKHNGVVSTVSDLSSKVDEAFMLILIISFVLLGLVTFFMVFFVIRYHIKRSPSSREVKEPLLLEITWTVIPTILVTIMFYVGWNNFVQMREAPAGGLPVKVTARMWSWQFEYENGKKESILRVPAGEPVKLRLTSSDVIHSFFIPDLKLKEDAVPGMYTTLWFSPDKPGEHVVFCAEYCGKGHSAMNTKVIVMGKADFDKWYMHDQAKKKDTAIDTLALLTDNGCLDCHSIDGSVVEAPTFKGIFGRKSIVVTNSTEREIFNDEEYLKRSILSPDSDIVKDYPDIMPSFEGVLSEKEISAIIEYLKRLK